MHEDVYHATDKNCVKDNHKQIPLGRVELFIPCHRLSGTGNDTALQAVIFRTDICLDIRDIET